MHETLNDIGITIIAASFAGLVAYRLRQPIIIAYLIAGALIGPQMGLKFITDPISIEIISEIGLILMLFIIGLEMDIKKIISSGKPMLTAGIGQFILCALMGLAVFPLFGYGISGANLGGLYLALLASLSSTAIVVKILYDKFETDTIPGRITIGVLIFQDIWAILIIAFQPNFAHPSVMLVFMAVIQTVFLVGGGFLLSRYVLKNIFELISKSPEMVVGISIGWCGFMAAAADMIGLSKEMGALIAGMTVSSFPYSVHVTAKVLPLRDFFLTMFFMSLGMKLITPEWPMILAMIGLVIFVFVTRFLSVYPLLSWAGSGRRTSFITSLNLSQISEFSLVIAALGVGYGHIPESLAAMLIYAMALSCVISSYTINANHKLYLIFEQILGRFGFKKSAGEETGEAPHLKCPIVMLGCHRVGRSFLDAVAAKHQDWLGQILVVDFNLEVLNILKAMNVQVMFGDISSADTLKHAHVEDAKIILNTIPDFLLKGTSNAKIIRICKALAPGALIIATAESPVQESELREAGAHDVLLPYAMMGGHLAEIVERVREESSVAI